MQKRRLLVLVVFVLCNSMQIAAQDNLKLQSVILDSVLTKNANAIVRSEEVIIEINSTRSVTVKTKRIVTVLNKLGKRYADCCESYDPTREIKKLEAVVYNSVGKEIKKYRKNDFQDKSAYDGFSLAKDDRIKYFDYIPLDYPYTLVFESEIQKESTAFINSWFPVLGYYLSVEKSLFKIVNPQKIPLKHKENNFEGYPIQIEVAGEEISYMLSNFSAIKPEHSSPSIYDIVPNGMLALEKFSLVGVDGLATDWSSFGKWRYDNLVKGRSKLPKETIQKVTALVADATTKKEKAKRIYEYVQGKTRYISVQLGIGGWMPMQAADVDRLGYGDCKALTNYTMALLDSQEIPSYYTVVYGDRNKKNIDSEFASMQGNHIILNIPDEEEDIWLECTSQTLPFNFIGDFTDDRNVLVVKPEGGEIKRTKKYLPEENTLYTKATVDLKSDKSMSAQVELVSRGLQYDWRYLTKLKSVKDQKLYYKEYWDYITNVNITSIDLADDKNIPVYTEKIEVNSTSYSSKAGSRLLITPNVFNRDTDNVPKYDNRKTALVISRGFIDVDEYIINIPEGYNLNKIPEKKIVETIFGSYSWELEKIDESQIKFKRRLKINDGEYPKEQYEAYRVFKAKIKNIDKSKIVLKQI